MKLYTYYRSTAAYRVRIALHYKNFAYESIPVNLLESEQFNIEYSAVNPQMRVPTLIDSDNNSELVLGQSIAILEYLEEKYPEPALLPKDIHLRAQVRAFCQLIACDMHPLNNSGVLQYIRKVFSQDKEEVNAWYFHWLTKGFDALEILLKDNEGPFCFGEQLTMADICLIPQIYNAFRFEFPMNAYPKLSAIYQHCLPLKAFDAAKPENQADAGTIDLSK